MNSKDVGLDGTELLSSDKCDFFNHKPIFLYSFDKQFLLRLFWLVYFYILSAVLRGIW